MSSDWKDWEYWVNAFPDYDDMNFDFDSDDLRAYVPFDSLGKKQVGRLVYQVIGKDGPVFNPRNIRYLSPGDPGYPSNLPPLNPAQGIDLSNLAPVFAGLNLVASVANLAVSAAVLYKVSKLEKQIEAAKRQVLAKLDVIDQKVTHIDIKVREIHLRESLNYLSKSCIRGNTIDLMEIKKFERDLEGFVRALEPFRYGNLAHRFDLSYDMRERLTAFHSFLFHTRAMVAQVHNLAVQEDPSLAISVDPILDYRLPEYLENCIQTAKEGSKMRREERANRRIEEERHTDKRSHPAFDSMSPEEKSNCGLVKGLALLAAERLLIKPIQKIDREHQIRVEEGLELPLRLVRLNHEGIVPTADVDKIELKTDLDKEYEIMEREMRSHDWKSADEIAWLWNTDMGLIWRVWKELKGLGDYHKEFPSWKKVAALPPGTNQIMIDCSSGQFIGLNAD